MDAAADLSVSWDASRLARGSPHHVKSDLGRGSSGGAEGGPRQARHTSYPAAHLRDPFARSRRRSADHSAPARSRGSVPHHRVFAPLTPASPRRAESTRAPAGVNAGGAPPVSVTPETHAVVSRPTVEVADILHAQGHT